MSWVVATVATVVTTAGTLLYQQNSAAKTAAKTARKGLQDQRAADAEARVAAEVSQASAYNDQQRANKQRLRAVAPATDAPASTSSISAPSTSDQANAITSSGGWISPDSARRMKKAMGYA